MDNTTTTTGNLTGVWTGLGTTSTVGNTTPDAVFTGEPEQCIGYSAEAIFDLRGDETKADSYVSKESFKNLIMPVLYTVLVVGVTSNLAFFCVIARVPHMRNTTNLYLANLAIADIAFIVISVGMYMKYFSEPVRSHYRAAKTLGCIGSFVGQYITYFASLGIVTLVSVERHSAICWPLRHRSVNTTRRAVKFIICSWILSFILSAVVMLRYMTLHLKCMIWPETDRFRNLSVTAGYCLPAKPWGLLLANLTETIPFIAAFIANMFMYVRIIRRLSNRPVLKNAKEGRLASMPLRALQVRNQVAKMLIANGIVFFLCNTPFVGISITFIVSHLRGIPMLEIYESMAGMVVISHGMLFLNSAVNPFIYNATSSHYRQAFKDAFCCADTSRRFKLENNNNSSDIAVISDSKKPSV